MTSSGDAGVAISISGTVCLLGESKAVVPLEASAPLVASDLCYSVNGLLAVRILSGRRPSPPVPGDGWPSKARTVTREMATSRLASM
ncbi:hypothetical protein VTN02DRAFT_2530 [Thermoascus thermophilus]